MIKINILGTNKGSVLIMALMLTLVIISLTMVGGILIVASRQDTGLHQNVLTQADNVARAGLVDAMSWFKRQTIDRKSVV